MATGTVYLDVDDEITSAAARIRGSEATKVALVMPYGSRIATSRMNFRLLSREALVNNRRLSIVATDPATRALAASAGLPVFATVAEWEAAAEPVATNDPQAGAPADPAIPAASGPRGRKKGAAGPGDEAQTLGLPIAAAADAAAAAAASAAAPSAGATAAAVPIPAIRSTPPESAAIATRRADQGSGRVPVVKGRSRPRIGGLAVVIAAVLVLAVVVAGVGAYVFLPSAQIIVTPRAEAMSIDLVVRADPSATAPDAAANVVPALSLDLPEQVSDTFTATDKRIVEEAAAGQVEFQSLNTGAVNTIPKGSVVSTEGGIKFQTTATITLPRAQVFPFFKPSTKTVGIVALKKGTAGNVPANAITVVPPGEDPTLTKVKNQAETTGGTHNEFPRIGQKDVDAAVASLTKKISDAFAADVASGAGGPPNATVFSETAVLGTPTPTVNPKSLVGKEQDSFDLGMTATGTVTAVDASPVTKIAETRLLATVGADHRLVDGSIKIVPGNPTVSNGQVTFPVNAMASRVRILDRAQLLAMVKGQSVEKARSLLAQFGDVTVTPWPDWVSTIPSIESRVTIEIIGQSNQVVGGSAPPSASAKPTATAGSSATGGSSGTSSPSGAGSPTASAAP